jgi:hypothetical protein
MSTESAVAAFGNGGLTRAVEVEITKLLGSSSSIIVGGTTLLTTSVITTHLYSLESLVVLNETDQSLLFGDIDQFLMILDLLGSGLGDENMMSEIQSLGSDWEMGRVGCEDDDC